METIKKRDDVTVIIRSAGERTEKVCKELIKSQVVEQNIHLIREVPFSSAVIKTFNIGIEKNRPWTLAIDADLLILENTINSMIQEAAKCGSKLYVYQGLILDKFKCGLRQGGPHLYLTKNLRNNSHFLDEIYGHVRPESFLYDKMKCEGYKIILEKRVFALHDFYQYHADIFRKAYFHAKKHKGWKNKSLPKWYDFLATDKDFKTAILGFNEGFFDNNGKYPHYAQLKKKFYNEFLNKVSISEKEVLNNIPSRCLDEILNIYQIKYYPEQNNLVRTKSKKTKILNIFIKFYNNIK